MPLSLLAYSGILTGPQVLPGAERLRRFIAEHKLSAEVFAVPENAPTSQDAARLLGIATGDIVKTMVLADKWDGRVIAIAPGDRKLDFKLIAGLTNLRNPKFATPALVETVTGYPAGGVAPIGFPKVSQVLIDASLRDRTEPVIGGGGDLHLLLRISATDIIRINQATVATITAP